MFVCLLGDDDILRALAAAGFAVFPDVVGTLGHFVQVGDFGKKVFSDVV